MLFFQICKESELNISIDGQDILTIRINWDFTGTLGVCWGTKKGPAGMSDFYIVNKFNQSRNEEDNI
jgi:hypothetical protein